MLGEGDLASHRRNPDGVAVTGYPAHHPAEEIAIAGLVEGPKAERVPKGDGTRPHREDVANDSAYSGGCSLVGLDQGGMVVTLDPEGGQPAVADVYHPSVLPWSHHHPGGGGRESGQVHAG